VYELTRRSENLALQPASPPLNEPGSANALLVETSNLGGENDILWDASPSCNNQALLKSNIDLSKALTAVPELFDQNTIFEWEPDAAGVEELEGSDVGANLYSNSAGNEFSLDWFSSGPLPGLTLQSTVSIPADCMFHTPYLVLRPVDFDYPSQTTSLLAPRSPFIHSHISSGCQIGRTFLLQSIQSYATLLATSSLPPFIHASPLLLHWKFANRSFLYMPARRPQQARLSGAL
jgi:hypothetical protein